MKIEWNFRLTLGNAESNCNARHDRSGDGTLFFESAQKEIELARANGHFRTADNYTTAVNVFRAFVQDGQLCTHSITTDILDAFQQWLLQRSVCMNTVSCYMRCLRAICTRMGIDRQMFGGVFTGRMRTLKRSMDIDDLRRLLCVKLRPGSRMELFRDIFIFQFCCLGMPFVDIAFLRREQIADGFIRYERRKTGQPVAIKLEPRIMQLVEKYRDDRSPYVFPVIRESTPELRYREYKTQLCAYNHTLKRIARKAGVEGNLTTYVARHTWATLAYQQNVELNTIAKAMGHTNPNTTMVYIKEIDNSNIATANRKVMQLLGAEEMP